jgi:dipeptidase E
MKILLASKEKFLIEKGYSLLGIPNEQLRIGYIITAQTVTDDLNFLNYLKECDKEMVSRGINFETFDLKGKSEKEILDFFSDKNVVHVGGGSPLYLLKIVRETGFDLILKKLLDRGLCYVGCSAGSYLMCPTMEVSMWKEGRSTYGLTDFTALNYVPFCLLCHYTEEKRDEIKEKMKTLKYPLRLLKDDQAILFEDGKYTFIGAEAETVIE